MKKILLIFILIPFILIAQGNQQPPMFMNVMMTPQPDKIDAFEAGLAGHNKKYHTQGNQQVNVFWVTSGKNSGKYVWSLGPTSWAAMEETNNYSEDHTKDWNNNVAANAMPDMQFTYWKNNPLHSNFTRDFELKNLSIFMLDIKRFKYQEFLTVLDKVYKVFKTKDPNQQWGVYFNELANTGDGDFVWVDFFDNTSWMDREDKFPEWYEEVHGTGSFAQFLKEFENSTGWDMQEIWVFRKDLSGSDGKVEVPN